DEQEMHIADAHVTGVRALVTLTEDAVLLPGFALLQLPADSPVATPPVTAPASNEKGESATEPADPVATQPAPLTVPKLRIDAFRCELERLELRDRRGDASEPIVLRTNLQLREPWTGD